MVTPMSMDVTTMATWTQRGPKASSSLPAMRCAAPESPMTRPTMAPRPMVSIVSPIWSPMPSERTSGMSATGMPRTRATPTATSRRAAKPFSFSLVIRSSRIRTLIPTTRRGMAVPL